MVAQGKINGSDRSRSSANTVGHCPPENLAESRSNAGNRPVTDRFFNTNTANSERETSQSSYLDLGITSKHLHRSKSKKTLKSEKLQIRYTTRQKIVSLLKELGEVETAQNMALCGQKFAVLTCGEDIVKRSPLHRCGVRYCPMCASRRASKYVKKYLPYASAFIEKSSFKLTPCLLTLTQIKIAGETLINSRERLMKSFHKFIRHTFFSEYFAGGIYAIENTRSDNGNHCHLHLVIFRKKFISADLLKERWAMVSLGAKNLHIARIDVLASGLNECIKYISKPVPVDKLERRYISELLKLKGKRMIDTFGEFRNFCRTYEPPEVETLSRVSFVAGECCPNCQKPLFEVIMTAPELIKFHRAIEQTRGSPQMKC